MSCIWLDVGYTDFSNGFMLLSVCNVKYIRSTSDCKSMMRVIFKKYFSFSFFNPSWVWYCVHLQMIDTCLYDQSIVSYLVNLFSRTEAFCVVLLIQICLYEIIDEFISPNPSCRLFEFSLFGFIQNNLFLDLADFLNLIWCSEGFWVVCFKCILIRIVSLEFKDSCCA